MLDAFTIDNVCRRKANRPPGREARAALARLKGINDEPAPLISLARSAQLAEIAS